MSSEDNPYAPAPLTATQRAVAGIVEDMELAFATGSYARVLTSMTAHAPYASDTDFLTTSMLNMPHAGWSCWDMSVFLAHALHQQGIDAGVTIAFGAEEGAPSTPHSIVTIIDSDTGETLYSDPYFGVGILGESTRRAWYSPAVSAHLSTPQRHYNTQMLTVAHRSHPRDYRYHILPGTLTPEQLNGALWQAESFGKPQPYIRIKGPAHLWLIRKNVEDSNLSTSRRWNLSTRALDPDEDAVGNWGDLHEHVKRATETNREASLLVLKSLLNRI